jgi:simple sugar transport system ATP-binding protein
MQDKSAIALVKTENIVKKFGGITALNKVNFMVYKEEIVGLVGDNGAGKSTLIRILSGVYPPEEGETLFEGKKVLFENPRQAREIGIETVYQDLALAPNMDVSMNMFAGREFVSCDLKILKMLDKRKMVREATQILKDVLGIAISSDAMRLPVLNLSGGQQQGVAIGRAIYSQPKLLIMDEPTAAISVKERGKVLELMKKLKKRGISIIFVSHNLDEIFSVVDRIVVLNRGFLVKDIKRQDTCLEEIVTIMLGGESRNNRRGT